MKYKRDKSRCHCCCLLSFGSVHRRGVWQCKLQAADQLTALYCTSHLFLFSSWCKQECMLPPTVVDRVDMQTCSTTEQCQSCESWPVGRWVEREEGVIVPGKNNHVWCGGSLGQPWHFPPRVYTQRWNSVPLNTGLHRVRLIRGVKESWQVKADRVRASFIPHGFCPRSLSHLQNAAFDWNVLISAGGPCRFWFSRSSPSLGYELQSSRL